MVEWRRNFIATLDYFYSGNHNNW